MIIKINNIEINKYELLHLINNSKKITAIKLLKTKTNLGLKACKDVVDNLTDNPNFYDANDYIAETDNVESYQKLNKQKRNRGSHIIESKTSNTKNYIIVILVFALIILGYLYVINL